jgi:hypothetical protein
MLHLVIILAWPVAFGLAVYLAIRVIKHRLWGQQKRKQVLKKIREFRKHHHFDEKRRYWVRNVDQVALIDESVNDRRFYLTFLGWLLFILWEGYWLLEIREQFVSIGRLQLPYMFLFLILFVVPLAWYLFLRRKLRRLAIIPMDAVRH